MKAEVDWSSGVSNAWRDIAEFVPKLIAFLVILIIGLIVARVLRNVLTRVLQRVGFDRVVERGGIKAALDRSNTDAAAILARIVYYAIVLITLELAFNVFGANPVSNLLSELVAWLPELLIAIIIVVITAAIARAVKDLITAALGGLSYGRMVANIASVFILALGVIAALNQIGIATAVTTPVLIAVLATVAGVTIVGVGGGLVRPMQQRWERWLLNAELEAPRVRQQVQSGPSATAQVTQQYSQQAQRLTSGSDGGATAAYPPSSGYGPNGS